MTTYIFDGTLEGLFCAVFEWFERKPGPIILKIRQAHHLSIFDFEFDVVNDSEKAHRIWKGLSQRLDKGWTRKIYCAYLSEQAETYQHLFEFLCYIFSNTPGSENNYGNSAVLHVSQMARKVEREKHRMEAFIRFQHTADGIFYCGIDPDFNVLPIILNHFKNRYADQQWIIYDTRRNYGLYYDLEKTEEIKMEFSSLKNKHSPSVQALSDKENLYACLWKDYFKSTNIPARKNMKLHIQHVPKRYWKYLTEKQL
ncbi:MAG: DNA metabolism protein [Chryseobacterium sp.]|nr:MAG: DNA metabolism protein [Chryseobacterium sp.]